MNNNSGEGRPGSDFRFSAADVASLPFSMEAEQAVLGAVLIDPGCLNSVIEALRPDCFYNEHHREIFSAMHRLFRAGSPIDIVTVLDELVGVGAFSEDSGKRYLIALAERVPSISNVSAYTKIIREKYELRMLILAARQIISDASDEVNETADVLDRAEQRIFEIAQNRASQGLRPISEVMVEALEHLVQLDSEDRDQYIGIPTGISTLDATITGLNKSDLIILAARPGMGKTSFALNIARSVAVNKNRKVVFFSLEMTCEQLALRILSTESGVEGKKLRDGRMSPDEWSAIAAATGKLHGAPIFLDERSDITVTEMKAKLRRLGDVGLVIIDYLQLMNGRNSDSRVRDVSEITRNLKIMAKELNVPVICLSQLNRMAENRSEHRPKLSDLRDSGSIEQDADIVLMLYREDYYAGESTAPGKQVETQNIGKAYCVVAKNRHGNTGDIELAWDGATTRFTAVEGRRDAQ